MIAFLTQQYYYSSQHDLTKESFNNTDLTLYSMLKNCLLLLNIVAFLYIVGVEKFLSQL
jgi:hypothetical protein